MLKIVMADDDPDDKRLIQMAFEEAGIQSDIHFESNGADLIKYLQDNFLMDKILPDMIIMDLNMPGSDGISALCELRSIDYFSGLFIIILTTSNNSDDKLKTLNSGANMFITKPSDFNLLLEIVQEMYEFYCESLEKN